MADHAIMQLYRRDVINLQRIATVARLWDDPAEDWGGPTAWRLFNATTSALAGRLVERPQTSEALHNVIDTVIEGEAHVALP